MNSVVKDLVLASGVIFGGAIGTFLLLPHHRGFAAPRRVRLLGLALSGLALLGFATLWTPPDAFLAGVFFYAFGGSALAAGAAMIASRDPIHSALWFAAVVLATAGLFLLAGAPFLAAGTVIVYAGAIIVMFLFVVMLAQQEGRAIYDRASRSPRTATITTFLLMWALIYALLTGSKGGLGFRAEDLTVAISPPLIPRRDYGDLTSVNTRPETALVAARSVRPTAVLPKPILVKNPDGTTRSTPPPHVAALAGALYTDHWVAVEVAGALLFVSMIAAVAITTDPRGRKVRHHEVGVGAVESAGAGS